jgi:hypothetical protein
MPVWHQLASEQGRRRECAWQTLQANHFDPLARLRNHPTCRGQGSVTNRKADTLPRPDLNAALPCLNVVRIYLNIVLNNSVHKIHPYALIPGPAGAVFTPSSRRQFPVHGKLMLRRRIRAKLLVMLAFHRRSRLFERSRNHVPVITSVPSGKSGRCGD